MSELIYVIVGVVCIALFLIGVIAVVIGIVGDPDAPSLPVQSGILAGASLAMSLCLHFFSFLDVRIWWMAMAGYFAAEAMALLSVLSFVYKHYVEYRKGKKLLSLVFEALALSVSGIGLQAYINIVDVPIIRDSANMVVMSCYALAAALATVALLVLVFQRIRRYSVFGGEWTSQW